MSGNAISPDAPADSDPPDWRRGLELLRGAFSDRTLQDWAHGFSEFEAWRRARGEEPVPAPPEAIAEFVDVLFQTYRHQTVQIRLSGIRMIMRALGFADPTAAEVVRLAVRRGKRLYGAGVKQLPGLTASLVERLSEVCGDDLRGLRDRAILRVGYDTLCRAGELVALRVEDVSLLPDGTARVTVRKEKQDYGGNSIAYLSRAGVEVLTAWLEGAGITEGVIFRAVSRGGNAWGALTTRGCAIRIKARALEAGLDPEFAKRLSTHSLRIGAVQDLTVSGASLLQIMRAGRWRDANQVAYYAREAAVNVWGQTEGDGYPLASRVKTWRRCHRPTARPPTLRDPTQR